MRLAQKNGLRPEASCPCPSTPVQANILVNISGTAGPPPVGTCRSPISIRDFPHPFHYTSIS